MLTYVEKLIRTPHEMTSGDVDSLRGTDFNDRDILDICTVAAYFSYVNRLASGLGVPLESWL